MGTMEENKTISQEELEQLMRDAIYGNEGAQCEFFITLDCSWRNVFSDKN